MRIVPKIGPDKVVAFSEKWPGREDGETAEFSNGTFLIFWRKVSREKEGRQQPNAEVRNGSQNIKFLAPCLKNLQERCIAVKSIIQRHEEREESRIANHAFAFISFSSADISAGI